MKKLRIAQLSTPFITVPPKNYGGIELVVHNITEELVRRGHKVTLFAPGGSKTSAKLVSPFKTPLNNKATQKLFSKVGWQLPWMHTLPSLYHAVLPFERAEEFDIIHDHFHYLGLLFSQLVKTPVVSTYHGDFSSAVKSPIEKLILDKYRNNNWTAISQTQKRNCPLKLNFVSVIYHGIQIKRFAFAEKPGDYLVWLGRVNPKKGLKEAIEVAKAVRRKLIISGFVNPRNQEFFNQEILPQIDKKLIFFKGALTHQEKVKLLKGARALLYPVAWEEPFGLVMIEAMACGTPVVGFRRGAVPEVVVDQETGFLVKNKREMIQAIKNIGDISRKACRMHIEKNFTVEKMVDKYEELYFNVLKHKT
jgi:glycosyltransferase involved in cell wall biosynthesis